MTGARAALRGLAMTGVGAALRGLATTMVGAALRGPAMITNKPQGCITRRYRRRIYSMSVTPCSTASFTNWAVLVIPSFVMIRER
jgi:hypothetical protein